jgi:nucleoside-diphosphate-sugar epimerase
MSLLASSVLVLGGRGRIGLATVRAFALAGWRVHAQVRPGASGPAIPGVQWLAIAPEDTAALGAAAQGASVVVHALSPAYTQRAWRADVLRLTDAAVAVTRELNATLMLPANVYNFGAAMPRVLTEETPQRPTTFKGRLRAASEQRIREATQDGRMKAVMIRAGDFFGSGSGSWLDLVIAKDLASGKLTYPGKLDVPTPWAYLPDLARTFVKVAERRAQLPAFETLHFGGHHVSGADWAEVARDIAWEQGWLGANGQLRVNSLSWPLMRAVALFVPTVAAICEMRYLWRTPHALANAKLRALIGQEPHTPFADAVRGALSEVGVIAADGLGGPAPAFA